MTNDDAPIDAHPPAMPRGPSLSFQRYSYRGACDAVRNAPPPPVAERTFACVDSPRGVLRQCP